MRKTICKISGKEFEVRNEDLKFYERVSPIFDGVKYQIPLPTLSPVERQRRRMAFRNELSFYKRKCDLSGVNFFSIYPNDSPHQIYSRDEWYSDNWDPLEYGREFDFERTFFEQFQDLHLEVPLLGINHQAENENCEYTNLTTRNRNCYYIFAANENEDCLYTSYLHHCNKVVDSCFIFNSELCYECIDCYNCYNLQYSTYCQNCSDSSYLLSCIGCNNCYGCISLNNKEYYIFNKQYSKDEYLKKLEQIKSRDDSKHYTEAYLTELISKVPIKYYFGINNENITGDHISYSKNSFDCYDCTYLEDCKYCIWLHKSNDCYDCHAWGSTGELGYENHLCGNNFYHLLFSDSCWNDVQKLIYCRYCVNGAKNCFASVGLKKKEFCILNKQYTEREYNKLVPKIINHMKETKEWGEFFPHLLSPFGYNETSAQDYLPLSRKEVKERGWNWRDKIQITFGRETIKREEISKIKNLTTEICKETLACKSCARNYRINKQEFKFYKEQEIEIPRECFDCRFQNRIRKRTPRQLWQRECRKTGTQLQTSFTSERPEIIYSEEAYLKEMF